MKCKKTQYCVKDYKVQKSRIHHGVLRKSEVQSFIRTAEYVAWIKSLKSTDKIMGVIRYQSHVNARKLGHFETLNTIERST
jgi:hypothetical protein